ncbi:MAG: hypothetical protein LBP42_01470, partial [Treponema sp.]|nr:hypothetical protein [Treponema sp.]
MGGAVEENSDPRKGKGSYRFLQIGIEILIFLALVAATIFILRPLQETIRKNMEDLRDVLLNRTEDLLDREIVYASIGPSIFGALDIRNIQIRGDDGVPIVFIARLRISYSLWDLVQGNGTESLRSIQLDRPLLTLDEERDADLLRLFSFSRQFFQDPAPSAGLTDFLPENFRLRIRGGEWAMESGPAERYRLEGFSLDASLAEGHIRFSSRWNAGAALMSFLKQPITLSMSGRIDGDFSADLRHGSARIMFPSLLGDWFQFHPVTVNLTLQDHIIRVQKINDRSPFDLSLDYNLNSGVMFGSFQCENFSPGSIFSLTGSRMDLNQWLSAKTSGEAAFERDNTGEFRYTINLSGAIPQNLSPGTGSFTVVGKGDRNLIFFDRFFIKLPQGIFRYQGALGLKPFAPNGSIFLSDFSLSGNEKINGELSVVTEGREISLFGEGISLGPVLLSALEGTVLQEREGFSFALSAFRFRNIESYEDVRLSKLSIEGSMDYNPQQIRGSLILDAFSLTDIAAMGSPFMKTLPLAGPAARILEDFAITSEVFITTDLEHISYNIPRFVLAREGSQEVFAVAASVSGTDLRFDLNDARIIWADHSTEVSGYADFSNPLNISFSLEAAYQELSYYFEGAVLDQRSLRLRGSYGLNAYVGMTDFGVYSGNIEIHDLPISLGGQYTRLSFSSSLYYDSPSFWSFDIDSLTAEEIKTPGSSQGSLRLSGRLDQDGAQFPEFFFDDRWGGLKGTVSASWGARFSEPHIQVNIGDEQGNEAYKLDGDYRDGILDLRLSVSRMQFARFFLQSFNVVATGDMQLIWNTNTEDSFSVDVNLENLSAQSADTVISLSAQALLDDEACSIQEAELNWAGFKIKIPFLQVDRRTSLAQTEGLFTGTLGGRETEIAFSLDFYFEPIRSWFKIKDALNSFNGTMNVNSAKVDTLAAEAPFQFIFSRDDEFLALSGGPGDMLRMQISREGDFYAGFSYPSPVRGAVIGTVNPKTIDAQGTDLYVDLASLGRFIPARVQEIISLAGGFATASIRIAGPLGDPEFFGLAEGY